MTAGAGVSTGLRWRAELADAPVVSAVNRSGTVAVGCAAGAVHLFDAVTGESVGETLWEGGVLALAWSPDGAVLAVGGPGGSMLWSPGESPRRMGSRWCAAAAWSNDRVALADGRCAMVIDRAGAQLWRTIAVPSTVTDLVWLPGRRLGVAAYGGVTCHQRGRDAELDAYQFTGSTLQVTLSRTGKWLVGGFQDATVHIWRTRDRSDLSMSGYPYKVTQVAFDATGRWLATNGAPDITVWDFGGAGPRGTTPKVLDGHTSGAATLAWHPVAHQLLSGGRDHMVMLWLPERAVPGIPARPAARWDVGETVTNLCWSGGPYAVVCCGSGLVASLDVESS